MDVNYLRTQFYTMCNSSPNRQMRWILPSGELRRDMVTSDILQVLTCIPGFFETCEYYMVWSYIHATVDDICDLITELQGHDNLTPFGPIIPYIRDNARIDRFLMRHIFTRAIRLAQRLMLIQQAVENHV